MNNRLSSGNKLIIMVLAIITCTLFTFAVYITIVLMYSKYWPYSILLMLCLIYVPVSMLLARRICNQFDDEFKDFVMYQGKPFIINKPFDDESKDGVMNQRKPFIVKKQRFVFKKWLNDFCMSRRANQRLDDRSSLLAQPNRILSHSRLARACIYSRAINCYQYSNRDYLLNYAPHLKKYASRALIKHPRKNRRGFMWWINTFNYILSFSKNGGGLILSHTSTLLYENPDFIKKIRPIDCQLLAIQKFYGTTIFYIFTITMVTNWILLMTNPNLTLLQKLSPYTFHNIK